ncbi:hypothetical protein LQ318_16225, partial [Aliifodinibius salicampi]
YFVTYSLDSNPIPMGGLAGTFSYPFHITRVISTVFVTKKLGKSAEKGNKLLETQKRKETQLQLIDLRTFENMSQIQFVDGDEILHGQGILFNIQHAGAPKINDAVPVQAAHYLSYPIVLRAGSVVHQVPELDIIIRPSIKGIDNRKPVESI